MLSYLLIALGLIVAVLALYTVVPDFFLHRWGLGSSRRHYAPGVALTFDDGPEPDTTPQILQALSDCGVQATFFVIAAKAQAHPELVRRIKASGHQVGLHSLRHANAWLEWPWQTWRQWDEALAIVEGILGETLEWVRPPWGNFNLFTWLWLKRRGKRAVMWNVAPKDWIAGLAPEVLAQRVVNRAREGAIVLLHDGRGGAGAACLPVPALELISHKIRQECKLPVVPLSFPAWSLGRRAAFVLWEKWERLYARLHRVERIDHLNILRLCKTKYRGPLLHAADGRLLAKPGDEVGEIHIDSARFQEQGTDMNRLGIAAMRQAKESLPVLARYIADNPAYRDVRVFTGFTLLHRAMKGFGFKVVDVRPSLFNYGVAMLQRTILRVYHPAGRERKLDRMGTTPKLVWISREELLTRWLDKTG